VFVCVRVCRVSVSDLLEQFELRGELRLVMEYKKRRITSFLQRYRMYNTSLVILYNIMYYVSYKV